MHHTTRRPWNWRATLAAALLLCGTRSAWANESLAGPIAAEIAAARAAYAPAEARDLPPRRAAALTALDRAAAWRTSAEAPTPDADDPWNENSLRATLAAEPPDLAALEAALHLLASDHTGRGQPPMSELRAAVRAQAALARRLAEPDEAAEFTRRLDALAAALSTAEGGDPAAARRTTLDAVAWLEARGLAPKLRAALAAAHAAPNVVVGASGELVTRITTDDVERDQPVRDTIKKTTIRGTAHVVGQRWLELVEGDGEAVLAVRFVATGQARTIGYQGPVRAWSRGVTQLDGTKRIRFLPEGFVVMPAEADCTVDADSYAFGTTLRSRLLNRFVSRIAARVATRDKAENDAIAACHAERDLRKQLDEEAAEELAEDEANYFQYFRWPLLRRDAFPGVFEASTTSERLMARLRFAGAAQLGADGPPPTLAESADVALALHETAIANLATTFLAGREIDEAELTDVLADPLTEPMGLPAAPASDAIRVTLAERLPLTFEAEGDRLGIVLRAERFIVDGRTYPPMNVRLDAVIERFAGGWRLAKLDAPQIYPPRFETSGEGRLSLREAAIRRILLNRLERDLPPSTEIGTFRLPNTTGPETYLEVASLSAQRGWLSLGLRRVEPPDESLGPISPPEGPSESIEPPDR